jgi:hypothetical protein
MYAAFPLRKAALDRSWRLHIIRRYVLQIALGGKEKGAGECPAP